MARLTPRTVRSPSVKCYSLLYLTMSFRPSVATACATEIDRRLHLSLAERRPFRSHIHLIIIRPLIRHLQPSFIYCS
jgi:hypothetical protein